MHEIIAFLDAADQHGAGIQTVIAQVCARTCARVCIQMYNVHTSYEQHHTYFLYASHPRTSFFSLSLSLVRIPSTQICVSLC